MTVLPGLDAQNYVRSSLHAPDRIWLEKNCYIDVWIEVLHALGLNPLAVMAHTLALDFEGDQWTFFKPPHDELRDLYGIDVQELNVWRPLIEHTREHLAAGHLISTEADAFWLPDTAGTDYRRQHTKSTIVLADIDTEAERLGYFHNAGYFLLEGEDFRQTFRLPGTQDVASLPLFAELVKVKTLQRLDERELADRSLQLIRRHARRIPSDNPVTRFKHRFGTDLPSIQDHGIEYYHAWAFGGIRQLGSAAELAALNLRWVGEALHRPFLESATALESLSTTCKGLILKLARVVNARKAADPEQILGSAERDWQRAMDSLRSALSG